MVDKYGPSFANDGGGYDDITHVITAGGQTAILAEIDKLKGLLPDATAQGAITPDFKDIPPHTAEKLRAEIDLLKTAIDAAPTS
jgi:hypothetical protein